MPVINSLISKFHNKKGHFFVLLPHGYAGKHQRFTNKN